MNTKSILIGIGVVSVIGIQLLTLVKLGSVESETKTTRESVGKLEKKVEAIEKIVMYQSKEFLNVSEKEFHCLAKNIFHEAGVEDKAGKIAVAQVTLNRLKSGRWGDSICEVVYKKAQFSWTLDKKKRKEIPKGKLWEESVSVANKFVRGHRVKGLESSHFYHTDYIEQPKWAKPMKVAIVIGQHIFYKG